MAAGWDPRLVALSYIVAVFASAAMHYTCMAAMEMVDFGMSYSATARDHQLFVDAFRNGRIPGL